VDEGLTRGDNDDSETSTIPKPWAGTVEWRVNQRLKMNECRAEMSGFATQSSSSVQNRFGTERSGGGETIGGRRWPQWGWRNREDVRNGKGGAFEQCARRE
jgi:hypothetical protein